MARMVREALRSMTLIPSWVISSRVAGWIEMDRKSTECPSWMNCSARAGVLRVMPPGTRWGRK